MRVVPHQPGWATLAAGTALAVTAVLSPATAASAAGEEDGASSSTGSTPAGASSGALSVPLGDDMRELAPGAKARPLDREASEEAARAARIEGLGRARVGQEKSWLAYDEARGLIYLKRYKLRAVGRHIQVWVAKRRAFPAGDCRNELGLTRVTDAQVRSFAREFNTTIYPKESRVFSTPPGRRGVDAATEELGVPKDYYKVGPKQADDIVVLVDNVRDANFYEPTTPDGQTFIAGFHWGLLNEYHDRNIMTIDAYDWRHRSGANPPDDSDKPAYKACARELGGGPTFGAPRPHNYEGIFAHEYQHLLEYYEDPGETSWVNEGLSDWAMTLTGYARPRIRTDRPGAESHLACFNGFLPRSFGGPENSLTAWEDQGGPEVLCDYGAASSFMEYLHSHYGNALMGRLHRENRNGLAGLATVLTRSGSAASTSELLRRWTVMVALDNRLDRNGRRIRGKPASFFTARSLSSLINWENPQGYNRRGAPPNGSDYVRLRRGPGKWFHARGVNRIDFSAAAELAPDPLEWTRVDNPPDSVTEAMTCGSGILPDAGPAALYSGCGTSLDRAAVREVTVQGGSATLTFEALWDIEEGYDFAFVQVSTDDGETWTTVPATDTTDEHAPDGDPAIAALGEGFTGDTGGGWRTQTVDLSAYAGQTVHLALRYVTDSGVDEAGIWVRQLALAGNTLDVDPADWRSASQVNPLDVDGFTVHLIGYHGRQPVRLHRLRLDRSFHGELSGAALRRALGRTSSVVAAIVTHNDPDEDAPKQAFYTLRVNGVVQPGGGQG
jgi:hypothetical protein